MAGASIKVTVKQRIGPGWRKLSELAAEMKKGDVHVKVGVLEGEGNGSDVRDGGLTNAELAAVHEFGSSDGRIPERSFIRSTFDANHDGYVDNLRVLLTRVVDGQMSLDQALKVMGLKVSTDIKKRVTEGEQVPPPNAPSTLARKTKLGRGARGIGYRDAAGRFSRTAATGVRTLIDTGRMIASVTYAVVRGGKD